MTKRKPRRKAAVQTGSRRATDWLFALAGVAAVGWIALGDARLPNWLRLAAPERTAARERLVSERRVAAPASEPVRAAAALADARPVPRPPRPAAREALDETHVAAIPRPVPRAAVPPVRPAAPVVAGAAPAAKAAEGEGGARTRARAPLRQSPSMDAPVWVTLERGRPVRVTARQGPWRRVEAGIFSGWVQADLVEARAAGGAAPSVARPASSPAAPSLANVRSRSAEARPVPPAAVGAR